MTNCPGKSKTFYFFIYVARLQLLGAVVNHLCPLLQIHLAGKGGLEELLGYNKK
jgi:hypothetical protein